MNKTPKELLGNPKQEHDRLDKVLDEDIIAAKKKIKANRGIVNKGTSQGEVIKSVK